MDNGFRILPQDAGTIFDFLILLKNLRAVHAMLTPRATAWVKAMGRSPSMGLRYEMRVALTEADSIYRNTTICACLMALGRAQLLNQKAPFTLQGFALADLLDILVRVGLILSCGTARLCVDVGKAQFMHGMAWLPAAHSNLNFG